MEYELKMPLRKKLKPMTLLKFNPMTTRSHVPTFNRMFSDFFENEFPFNKGYSEQGKLPAVNISESESEFHIELSVAGFKKSEIQLAVEENVLSVTGEKSENTTETTKKFSRKEFTFQNFKRSFNLPESVNQDKIEAKFEDGILKIELPKKELAQKAVRKIELV